MKTIKIIHQLDIENGYLVASNERVFLQQGSIDGACGPYCIFMAMIILGIISYDEATNLWWSKGSTKFGKLITKMRVFDTLFQNGTYLHDLEELLKSSYKNQLEIITSNEKGRKLIDFVVTQLRLNKPTIIGVNGSDLGHWLLAIGFEEDKKNEITKLYFLDPSSTEGPNYWNAIIKVDISHFGRYPYCWINKSDNLIISFEEGMSLFKL